MIMLFPSSSTSAKIYIHRKGQFLDLNGRMGYKVLKVERGRVTIKLKKKNMFFKGGCQRAVSGTGHI